MQVLACFTVERPTLSLTEISERCGLPLSTTRRLVLELVEHDALERLPSRNYRIGIRLWEIGSLAPQQRLLREAALPFMHDLYEATQENVQLVVLDGIEALCVEKVSGRHAVPTQTNVGGRLPLYATGVGKALLAYSPACLLEEVVRVGLQRLTPYTLVEPGRLIATLLKIKETHLAYSHEEMTVGAVSVAAPVMRSGARPTAAIGIVARADTSLDRLGPAVRTAALGLARALY